MHAVHKEFMLCYTNLQLSYIRAVTVHNTRQD